jgi:hypothetical protein
MVFVRAVAAVCALAGAKNFRETGDQAADLPQEVLAALGGKPHPLRRVIMAPSEKRIRALLQALDAAALDLLIGGWLAALAAAGRLQKTPIAIAADGKWLRGIADGQVKLFAAMLHDEKVMVGQVRVPDEKTETTQVRELWAAWTWTARWSPRTLPMPSAIPRSTSPTPGTAGTGNRTISC